jgi:putative sterol carrier protein
MPTKEQVFESLDGIRKKLDEPDMKEKFKGFKRDMQFKFPDLNVTYVLSITEDSSATLKEGTVEKPNIAVEMDSATFLGIRNKTISGTQAYMSGKLKVKGAMPDLLKLQRLM